MIKREKRLLRNSIVFFILGWIVGFGMPAIGQTQEGETSLTLTAEDIHALRARIFSRSVDYQKRVQIASTLTRLFEVKSRPRNARRLCLDFYDSIAPILEEEISTGDLGEPYSGFALSIDQGKRRDPVVAMEGLLQSANKNPLHPSLSLLALKADYMMLTYRSLFDDFIDQKLSPYSLYVLGILATREKRFIEGERFMVRAQGKFHSPIFDRWLSIDLAKLSIVNNKDEDARQIIQGLLEKNPQDPQALNIMIFSNLANKKDLARQQLTQLIHLLYPDPYLIAETAKLAIQLMELDTASRILELYESKVEPNRDFYETLAFVRKNQGRQAEADQYIAKARQIHDTRVAVTSEEPLSNALKEAVVTEDDRRKEMESLEGVDTLSKVYYCLLDEDHENAIHFLQKENSTPYESLILSTIQRRVGHLQDAAATLKQLKTRFPDFRSYETLSLLADYSIRNGSPTEAHSYYHEILDRFPDSYQADIARNVISSTVSLQSATHLNPIHVSSRMSRYFNYAAPFILTEIREHWGDPASFATFTNLLRVSPRKGILFHEFVTVLASITRHQVIPFIGLSDAVVNCLQQDIPVVYCQGDMFENQSISQLSLLVGTDPLRGQFYSEGITPYEPHLYTEQELLEGICFAVYPSSLEPLWSPLMNTAIAQGKEYIKFHLEASHISTDPDYDATHFFERQQTILQETNPSFLPEKLAFARWTIRNKPSSIASQYLSTLHDSCRNSSHFWFLNAILQSNQKNADEAKNALEKALSRQPEYPRYVLARVRILDQTQQIDEAIRQAENLRDECPENQFVSSQLLLLYKKTGATNNEKLEEERFKKLLHVENVQIDSEAESDTSSLVSP